MYHLFNMGLEEITMPTPNNDSNRTSIVSSIGNDSKM
jgi:hypothetical protein